MEAAGRCILPFFLLTAATALALEPGEKASTADKVAWLESNAATLRSINPKDRDYSDLQPLRQAIGNARVVLLGGGNDAGIMKARYRLLRFLHEEMGFDVFTTDLPLFDAEDFDHALDRGKSPRPDLEEQNERLFWYFDSQVERLNILNYVRDTHKTDHPLHLSGFGRMVSSYMALEYTKRLWEFIDRVAPKVASPADRKAIQELVELCAPLVTVYSPVGVMRPGRSRPQPKQWEKSLVPGLDALQKVYEALGRLQISDPNFGEIVYFRQTMSDLASVATGRARRPLRQNPPDSAVAMAHTWHAKNKIVVWSGNWTVGRNWPPVKRSPDARPIPLTSTGIQFARVFGPDAYAIAFREIKNDNGVLQLLDAGSTSKLTPVDGDLESLLHAAGKPYSFVDFRSLPADHWLRTPLSARIVNGTQVDVWPDHYDGLVTIDVPVLKESRTTSPH